MKIRQIQLIGFKSFAEKSTITFHSGITCIVGPNGCGKSNIVDAFRWVLGEQSAKSLRGDKMEEVIFQGTAQRKPKGMAEVSLSFDKDDFSTDTSSLTDPSQPPKEPQVTVCRRLYRSGESEYLIGNRPCRLKDIRDIFLDTGLDVKSYSILDQGRISDIVNAKPIDRRFIIEEVAGVMKYKVKKAEAISKLESAKENLQRVNDIIYEVKRQLSSLDRLVKKAEKYQRLIDELKVLELRTFKRNHIALTESLKSLQSELTSLQELEASHKAQISTLETQSETLTLNLTQKEKSYDTILKQLTETKTKIAEVEKRLALIKNTTTNDKASIEAIDRQANEAQSKKSELTERLKEFIQAEQDLLASIKDTAEDFEHRKRLLEQSTNQLHALEASIDALRKEVFRQNDALSAKKNEHLAIKTAIDRLAHQKSTATRDIDAINQEIARINEKITKAQEELAVKTKEHQKLNTSKSETKEAINTAEAKLTQLRSKLLSLKEDIASKTARMQSLKELSVDKGTAELIKELSATLKYSPALLSDFITVVAGYDQAVEAVLAERTNAIVLKSKQDALIASDLIKKQRLSKTALAIENAPNPKETTITKELPLKRLSEFVQLQGGVLNASAFDSVYVAQDLETALKLLPEASEAGLSIVTLQGELVMPDGSILVGKGKEVLTLKREINQLLEAIEGLKQDIALTEQAIKATEQEISTARETLKGFTTKIITNEREQSLLTQTIKTSQDEIQRNQRRLNFLHSDLETFEAEQKSLVTALEQKANEVNSLQAQVDELNDKLKQEGTTLQLAKKTYSDDLAIVHDLELTLATTTEKINAVKSDIFNTNEALQDCDERINSAKTNIERLTNKIARLQAESSELEINLKDLILQADKLNAEATTLKAQIDEDATAIKQLNTTLKELRGKQDAITDKLNTVKNAVFEHTLKIDHLTEAVNQKYAIDITQAEIDYKESSDEADLEAIKRINEKIQELGPVSIGSLQEYEELKNRYEFLTSQQEDLTKSIAELEEAINKINSTTRKKLKEAFEQLRVKFSEVFCTLFGGGKADLILTDENNILESGIEIIAQPPGKKLQNLSLLSGGEKALTSLALLFAGFLIKPSALCILDEADAPLDESNTVRFTNMLKSLSQNTQFIIITHNRLTMQSADYIYGITSEEQGVSKVISLRFSDIDDTVRIN